MVPCWGNQISKSATRLGWDLRAMPLGVVTSGSLGCSAFLILVWFCFCKKNACTILIHSDEPLLGPNISMRLSLQPPKCIWIYSEKYNQSETWFSRGACTRPTVMDLWLWYIIICHGFIVLTHGASNASLCKSPWCWEWMHDRVFRYAHIGTCINARKCTCIDIILWYMTYIHHTTQTFLFPYALGRPTWASISLWQDFCSYLAVCSAWPGDGGWTMVQHV